jgi:hypothetical protein
MGVDERGNQIMGKFKRATLGVAAVALSLSSAAPAASSACWSQADISAAKVRQMQTQLMVAALRCRAGGVDILASYNHFLRAKRSEITAADDRLKAHFRAANRATGERDYDRYTTSLANAYGGARTSETSCADAASMADEAASSRGSLVAVADREIGSPRHTSGRCSGRDSLYLAAE